MVSAAAESPPCKEENTKEIRVDGLCRLPGRVDGYFCFPKRVDGYFCLPSRVDG